MNIHDKKLLFTTACGLMAFCLTTLAHAQTSIPMGWYLSGGLGMPKVQNGPGSTSGTTIGTNVNVGYKFMSYFAGEVGLTQYGDMKIESGGKTAGKDKRFSLDLAGKIIWPIEESPVELYAKLGMARTYSSVNISNATTASSIGLSGGTNRATGLYLGAGGDYYFSSTFAAHLQWARAMGSNTTGDSDLYSIGVSYIFG